MRKKWIVTYYGPQGKWLTRRFRALVDASLFRTVMDGNIPISDRHDHHATVWHKDDIR